MSSRTLLGCIELGLLAGIAVLTFAATAGSQAATGVSRFAADPPAPPGKPVVLEKGLNTLSVTWTALDKAVGDATSHAFEYRQGTSGDWVAGPQGLRGTRAAIGSLATDTDYQVRMRARNAAGGGKADRCADACGGGDSGTRHLPQLLRQGSAGVGLLRGIGQSGRGGEVSIEAIDDRGTSAGTVMLTIGSDAAGHFNSADLEQGNPSKGLSGGAGSGAGDWRLIVVVDSELEFEVLSYVRTADGFLTSMHDTAPKSDGVYEVAIFNPGSNPNQLSRLRLINLDAEEAEVTITGVDDAGACSRLRLPARRLDGSPAPDAHFDAKYAFESLCHASDKVQAFQELFRLLRPGATTTDSGCTSLRRGGSPRAS